MSALDHLSLDRKEFRHKRTGKTVKAVMEDDAVRLYRKGWKYDMKAKRKYIGEVSNIISREDFNKWFFYQGK